MANIKKIDRGNTLQSNSIFNCKFHRIGDEFRADVVTKRCSLLRKGEKLMYNKYIIIYFSDLFNFFRSNCTRKYHMNILDCTRLYSIVPHMYSVWVLLGIFRCRKYPNVPECTPNVPECTTNVPECTPNVPECTVVLLWYFCGTSVVPL